MENPQSWNLLTSSLAVGSLDDLDAAWAFLVLQELIDPQVITRQLFDDVVRDVRREGDITGPSEVARISGQLLWRGGATRRASLPDPWARIAESRLKTLQAWRE